jgi:hypothetical protein
MKIADRPWARGDAGSFEAGGLMTRSTMQRVLVLFSAMAPLGLAGCPGPDPIAGTGGGTSSATTSESSSTSSSSVASTSTASSTAGAGGGTTASSSTSGTTSGTGGSGGCIGASNGTPCDDGDACTTVDTCQEGVCKGTMPAVCAALDACHVVGTCDPSTGVCSNPKGADGTACDDLDACTKTDTCVAGACVGGGQVVCGALDQCHTAGTCDTATGVCSNPNKSDGVACSDGNACTQSDTCQSGACSGANPVVCAQPDQCHTLGACDSGTGTCVNPAKSNNSMCDDGDPCTLNDSCQNAVCHGSPPSTATDPHNCGTCGHECFGDATSCVSGQCQIVDPGWGVTLPNVRSYGFLDTTPDGQSLYLSTIQGVSLSPIGITLPAPTPVVAQVQVSAVATNGALLTWGIGANGAHPGAATIGSWVPAALATPASDGPICGIAMLGNYVWYVDFGNAGGCPVSC